MIEPEALVERSALVMLVSARLVVVAFARVVLPTTERLLLALIWPPTLRTPLIVVEPVTARDADDVAPTVVSPPLNASVVEVALPMNGYAKVSYADSDELDTLLLKVVQSAELK